MELLVLLAMPFAGGLVLAALGHRSFAPELNSGISLLTLLAAGALTARVIADGPQLIWNENFLVDPFNVFLVALTAFVAFTTSLFSRPYMRIEAHNGRLSPQRLRLWLRRRRLRRRSRRSSSIRWPAAISFSSTARRATGLMAAARGRLAPL